ncbi:MAG: SNF2-related protein [Planctomycetota bacterium]|nr:SNF2-related protein [Planctomycetota bacterium]
MDATIVARGRTLFLEKDIRRGESYVSGKRVTIAQQTASLVTATVMGSYGQAYQVEIEIENDLPEPEHWNVRCDCPRFEDGFNCKHIWATLRSWGQVGNNATTRASTAQAATFAWKQQLDRIAQLRPSPSNAMVPIVAKRISETTRQYWFAICLDDQVGASKLWLRLFRSLSNADGQWTRPTRYGIPQDEIDQIDDATDRELFSLLRPREVDAYRSYVSSSLLYTTFSVPLALQHRILSLLGDTQRLVWSLSSNRIDDAKPLSIDTGSEWMLTTHLRKLSDDAQPCLEIAASLSRNGEHEPMSNIVFAFADGLVLFQDRLARFRPEDAKWIKAWHEAGPIRAPEEDLNDVLHGFSKLPHGSDLKFADDLGIESRAGKPQPKLVVSRPQDSYRKDDPNLLTQVSMQYGGETIDLQSSRNAFWDAENWAWLTRDLEAEAALMEPLKAFPFTERVVFGREPDMTIHRKCLPQLVTELVASGWEVMAHGKLMRAASSFSVELKTDTDWFDLNASVNYGSLATSLPSLLDALQGKQNYVVLDDGSLGLLPDEWLQRYAPLAEFGRTDGPSLRFSKSQALLLDCMLAEQDNVKLDRDFTQFCKKMAEFNGIKPGKEPRGFQGELREYQRDGLGWFGFLRDFEFGGCLADDMGLGKTVQVLAMLQARRTRRLKKDEKRLPSIVVVPKSLIFNWMEEAERFAPRLRVLNYTGLDRRQCLDELDQADVLITTYGTLRRDIGELRYTKFDYAILDESQAIKNANSQAAKACQLLEGRHRLAMTGTPVENHLGELWSLFNFLNPGMLGNSNTIRRLTAKNADGSDNNSAESLEWLRRGLRPFMLRRTKEQVLKELPDKTEQTLTCEMTKDQSKLYDELRTHYRAHISKTVDKIGIKRSKIHVLEALLRLRQAACDPRLIDPKSKVRGAKVELLLEQLEEILAEGHKALVFSQFTSMLALVRPELEKRKWTYEYLDGKTNDRAARVHRFQDDADCKLFLISLKAGGHGLNLTAADYVFILDPWWNPAVEAQAIDRAHRMGQTHNVMAYRIICRDTVEEKILQLQQSKRDLADAIISANQSLIGQLSMDDLQMLFS